MKNEKPIIGITCGDLNGIGLELICSTFSDKKFLDICTPVIYAPLKAINYYRNELEYKEFNFNQCKDLNQIDKKKVNIINTTQGEFEIELGKSTPTGGKIAREALLIAGEDLKQKKIDALVTCPINKNNIQSEDFNFPGHTEYLNQLNGSDGVMILMTDQLRVAVYTGHIPVADIAESLTKEKLTAKIQQIDKILKLDFQIRKPKIAVLGLNPHAGDDGLIGKEDKEIILPVCQEFQENGDLVFGPMPADGFFGSGSFRNYDAILAMYHDQGLIPFKTLSFGSGVNYTGGLNFIRTSPDHGTAFDIVGQNKVSTSSFREAIYQAIDIFKTRNMELSLLENALKPEEKKQNQRRNQQRETRVEKN